MYHHLSQFYDQLFPWNSKIEDLIKPYVIKSGHAIDLGCGTGRLTNLLNQLGMNVIGIDLDQEMIEVAGNKYPHITFLNDDMVHSLKRPITYDLMTCFGNTLPHLSIEELKMFFMLVGQRLTNSGVLIVQLLNYKKILSEKPEHLKEIKNDQVNFIRLYTYHQDHILFKTILKTNNKETVGTTKLYPYQKEDLEKVIDHVGLTSQAFGDFSLKPFEEQDYYLYLIISKK
ncbi:MAG: class I SAM-dependent methyltransferase [Tenericutes bacterium]|nr:class I SAM-dependent methyltransferase [Mycoplasmatota bacterium]